MSSLEQLVSAATSNDAAAVSSILAASPDLAKAADADTGLTALHEASRAGAAEGVRALLSGPVSVDQTDATGTTALICAADGGHLDVVKLLVAVGAHIDKADNTGASAICVAARAGHTAVVQFLIQSGAHVNHVTSQGSTPIVLASIANKLDCVKALATEGKANVRAKDNEGQTALHAAAQNGFLDIVRFLISFPEIKANINCTDEYGDTALHLAAENNCADVVLCLVREAGASINAKNSDGDIPSVVACAKGSLNALKALVECGAPINGTNCQGVPLIALAKDNSHRDLAHWLQKNGAVDNEDDSN